MNMPRMVLNADWQPVGFLNLRVPDDHDQCELIPRPHAPASFAELGERPSMVEMRVRLHKTTLIGADGYETWAWQIVFGGENLPKMNEFVSLKEIYDDGKETEPVTQTEDPAKHL